MCQFFLPFFSVIFSQVKNALGGRVRIMVSGGAPLSSDTHEFIKTCLCNLVLQGYGLTETCAAATAMDGKFLLIVSRIHRYIGPLVIPVVFLCTS